jgi:hypothetical protein
MLFRAVFLLLGAVSASGCLGIGLGFPHSSSPQAYPNGVAIDSIGAAAMMRHFSETRCSLDDMRVRDRLDVNPNAVEVEGCGATRIYTCVTEIDQPHYSNPRAHYVCTDTDDATAQTPQPASASAR